MNILTKLVISAIAVVGAANAIEPANKIVAGEPALTGRTISYRNADIVPISAEIRFSTLIELPKEETIAEVTCGDKELWPINWKGNLAYVKPAKQGARTNLNLIAQSGNVYSFYLTEVSETAGAHADLKVFVNPADDSSIVAMNGKPRFVAADAVAIYEQQADEARRELADEKAVMKQKLAAKLAEVRAAYPQKVRHDYSWNSATKNPFHVSAIWHDDRFTYIEAAPDEAPAIYEIKDGKDSLIQFEFRDGRYVIPKIVDQGYMRVGKSELKFQREG